MARACGQATVSEAVAHPPTRSLVARVKLARGTLEFATGRPAAWVVGFVVMTEGCQSAGAFGGGGVSDCAWKRTSDRM